jgi:hypothetical protein
MNDGFRVYDADTLVSIQHCVDMTRRWSYTGSNRQSLTEAEVSPT